MCKLEGKILLATVKCNTSCGAQLTLVRGGGGVLQEELFPDLSAPDLPSPEVAGAGVGKEDAHVSLCTCPSFLVPRPLLKVAHSFSPSSPLVS